MVSLTHNTSPKWVKLNRLFYYKMSKNLIEILEIWFLWQNEWNLEENASWIWYQSAKNYQVFNIMSNLHWTSGGSKQVFSRIRIRIKVNAINFLQICNLTCIFLQISLILLTKPYFSDSKCYWWHQTALTCKSGTFPCLVSVATILMLKNWISMLGLDSHPPAL